MENKLITLQRYWLKGISQPMNMTLIIRRSDALLLASVVLFGIGVNTVVLTSGAIPGVGAISMDLSGYTTDRVVGGFGEPSDSSNGSDKDESVSDTSSAAVEVTVVRRKLPIPRSGVSATVDEIVDVNRIRVTYDDVQTNTLTLEGVEIQAFEFDSGDWDSSSSKQARECVAEIREQANNAIRSTILHEPIEVILTSENHSPRAFISVNGTVFNYDLIVRGYGGVPDIDFELKEEFINAQAAAKNEGNGIWGCDILMQ